MNLNGRENIGSDNKPNCQSCLDNRLTQKFKKWHSLIKSIYENNKKS